MIIVMVEHPPLEFILGHLFTRDLENLGLVDAKPLPGTVVFKFCRMPPNAKVALAWEPCWRYDLQETVNLCLIKFEAFSLVDIQSEFLVICMIRRLLNLMKCISVYQTTFEYFCHPSLMR